MRSDEIPGSEKVHLLNGWSAHIVGGYRSIGLFLTNSFGSAITNRWSGKKSGPTSLSDAVVAATMDAVIAECLNSETTLDQFAAIIGHRYLSRDKPAFHNYTPEQVKLLVPMIARLLRGATEKEWDTALDHHREDDLFAYLMFLYEDVPMDYTRAALGS